MQKMRSEKEITTPLSVEIPGLDGYKKLEFFIGTPSFIVGPNGSGKSALVQFIRQKLENRVVYLPGSRSSLFRGGGGNLSVAQVTQLVESITHHDITGRTRWDTAYAYDRNDIALFNLAEEENFHGREIRKRVKRSKLGEGEQIIAEVQNMMSPLEDMNAVLSSANLPIRLELDRRGALEVTNSAGEKYPVNRASDGERSATIIASEIIVAEPQSWFLLDEPELHLHPSIINPLLGALIEKRTDCGFIISSHNLQFVEDFPESQMILTRDCKWSGEEVQSWDFDVLPNMGEAPEYLRVDILGSRRKVIFTEGDNNSLDYRIYAILFPDVSIRPLGSSEEVIRAVKGLNKTMEGHHLQAFGIIDQDGMSTEAMQKFHNDKIFPLPVSAVESLYYAKESMISVAKHIGSGAGETLSSECFVEKVSRQALEDLDGQSLENLASYVAEKKFRNQLSREIPGRKDLKAGASAKYDLSIENPFSQELEKIKELKNAGEIHEIIARYPVKKSRMLHKLSVELGFKTPTDYCNTFLTVLRRNKKLQDELRSKFGKLKAEIESG